MIANDNFYARNNDRRARELRDLCARDTARAQGIARHSLKRPLLTDATRASLVRNGAASGDRYPVVRIYMHAGPCNWLLSYILPYESDLAYGLVDLGTCAPFLSLVSLPRLAEMSDPRGYPLQLDADYSAEQPLSQLVALAGGIIGS
jgi:hypothetical protein